MLKRLHNIIYGVLEDAMVGTIASIDVDSLALSHVHDVARR